MKALSMYQPYAWLVVNGYTDIDDRTWPCSYRGDLVIHAAKKLDMHMYAYAVQTLGIQLPHPDDLEYGGVVGIVNMTGCLKPGEPTDVPHERRAHGGPHCYGFVFDDIRKLDFIPARGMPGLFEIDINEAVKKHEDSIQGRQRSMF